MHKYDITAIEGLQYISNYIAKWEHDQLIDIIDQQVWLSDLKRRVQHYGYKYDYKKRAIDNSMYLGTLPDWALTFAQKLHQDGLLELLPDQVIVNEYKPGQGIASHVDCESCFGETIISLSLGSACVMGFTNIETSDKVHLLLEPCSLLIFQEEARYKWKHGISPRKKDIYQGQTILRDRRISLTFRNVILIP